MRSALLLEVFHSVDQLDVEDSAKAQFKQILYQLGVQQGVKGLEKLRRIEFAAAMLRSGVSRTTAKERLCAHYEVSTEQAYRYLRDALKLCHQTRNK
jgi:histone deacetylase complex regulatory component SIN3